VTPGEKWNHLSERGRLFMDHHTAQAMITCPDPHSIQDTIDASSLEPSLRKAAHLASQFNAQYEGTAFPVLGGQLEGKIRLGVRGSGWIWRTDDGVVVYRAADHDSAQCAMVLSAEGVFGCSWIGEFTPLFDSLDLLLEHCAAWLEVQGWHHAAVLDTDPATVVSLFPEVTIDNRASGRLAQWWAHADVHIVAAPSLNPRSNSPEVLVLTRRLADTPKVQTTLLRAGHSVGDVAAKLKGRVPTLG